MDGGVPSEQRGRDRGAESRERFVDAAVELVVEHYDTRLDLRDVFSYLTPGSVAERAGLSRALLYHHWSDAGDDGPDAFSAFLAEVAERLRERSSAPQDHEALVQSVESIDSLLLAMCRHELHRPDGVRSAVWRATTALNLLGVISRAGSDEVIDQLAAVYELLGRLAGWEMIPPLRYRDLAAAIASVLNGWELTVRELSGDVERSLSWVSRTPFEQDGDGWDVLAIAVESLLLGMTRPVAAPGRSQPADNRNTPSDSDST